MKKFVIAALAVTAMSFSVGTASACSSKKADCWRNSSAFKQAEAKRKPRIHMPSRLECSRLSGDHDRYSAMLLAAQHDGSSAEKCARLHSIVARIWSNHGLCVAAYGG